MKISNIGNNIVGILVGSAILFPAISVKSQTVNSQTKSDTFEKVSNVVTPQGVTDESVLLFAPSSDIEIQGETRKAKIVVDLSKNILYKYDDNGDAQAAYLIASGKKTSPTDVGVRMVTHVEKYPYKTAPWATKRRRNPNDYGPRIICLETVNPKTGAKGSTGEFIHGNKNPNSLGKYASLGCIRMDNEVIKELATQVKKGDIVVIKK